MKYYRKGVEASKLMEFIYGLSKINPRLAESTELEYTIKANLKQHKIQNGQIFARPDQTRLYFRDSPDHSIVTVQRQEDERYTVRGFYSTEVLCCGECQKKELCQFVDAKLTQILGRPEEESPLEGEVRNGNHSSGTR